MYIEDIVAKLVPWGFWSHNCPQFVNQYDLDFLVSLQHSVNQNLGFTEKQRHRVTQTLKKHSKQISVLFNQDVTSFIENPQFKSPVRVISQDKKVQIVEENGRKLIRIAFPFEPSKVEAIKLFKKEKYQKRFFQFGWSEDLSIIWNQETRTWDFELLEEHIYWIGTNFRNFEFDGKFQEFFSKINEIYENMENYVPMVKYQDGKFCFVNVHEKVPQPTSNNLLEVLFEAKKYGINIWDEAIDLALKSKQISSVFRTVAKNNSRDPIVLEPERSDLSYLKEIVSLSKNVLFVIPGGTELEHLKVCYGWLKSENYQNNQMTVMFRLDSSSGAICNQFIRDNNLNTPLSDEVNFVFVSGKIPKPLIESGKQFDTVIYFGTNSAHFTLKNFIKNHYNVISLNLITKNKE